MLGQNQEDGDIESCQMSAFFFFLAVDNYFVQEDRCNLRFDFDVLILSKIISDKTIEWYRGDYIIVLLIFFIYI